MDVIKSSKNFWQEPTIIVCAIYIKVVIGELGAVKRDIFKLTRFYFDILDKLREIRKVKPDFDFWDDEVASKFRDWKTGKEGRSYLRNSNRISL